MQIRTLFPLFGWQGKLRLWRSYVAGCGFGLIKDRPHDLNIFITACHDFTLQIHYSVLLLLLCWINHTKSIINTWLKEKTIYYKAPTIHEPHDEADPLCGSNACSLTLHFCNRLINDSIMWHQSHITETLLLHRDSPSDQTNEWPTRASN